MRTSGSTMWMRLSLSVLKPCSSAAVFMHCHYRRSGYELERREPVDRAWQMLGIDSTPDSNDLSVPNPPDESAVGHRREQLLGQSQTAVYGEQLVQGHKSIIVCDSRARKAARVRLWISREQ